MERLKIIIDTREQTPWAFPELEVIPLRACLRAGDYALYGDEHFAIERKNLDDFLGTISTGWERFERELARMDEMDYPAKIIIIEGDFVRCCFTEDNGQIVAPKNNHPRLKPQFITKRIAQLTLSGVSVLFAHNPMYAMGLALVIFRQRQRQLEENGKN